MLLKVTDRDGHRVIFFLLDQRQTFRGRLRINVLFLVEDCFVSACSFLLLSAIFLLLSEKTTLNNKTVNRDKRSNCLKIATN